jgi:L-fuculose-phosphate aldolase
MWNAQKKEIIETIRKLVQNDLVSGTSGNASIRLKNKQGPDCVAITPSSFPYDLLEIDNIAVVGMDGKQIEGNAIPSIEMSLHLEIYRKRHRINGIIHTHSVYATAMAVAGIDIPPVLDDQILYLGGEIKVSRHALPGSIDMVNNVVAAMGNKNAVLIANHGALSVGKSLREAFDNSILLERLAKIYIHASQAYMYSMNIKKIKKLSSDAIEKELSFYKTYENSESKIRESD